MSHTSFLLAIDTGGTFTDAIAVDNFGEIHTCKVLSNSTLRGTVLKILGEKSFQVHNNWMLEKDIFQGYTFKVLNAAAQTSESLDTPYLIEKYDFENKIIHLKSRIFT